ncbi:MAG: peptide ABC transporter ATP-binding protein [Epulopiscium sp. Nuni2H_MBin003]|nr:MAG: peptide ABC transporter ATP-binding protein [Epulopiscium sp. Nuni2H_MBin003]
MLEFNNISVYYDNGTQALKDFNLSVADAEIVALVGESGSGKSTAIRAAMGLLPAGGEITSGEIILNNRPISNLKEWNTIRGKEIAMIFQDNGAMLNPIRTIGSQFVEYIQTHAKVSKKEAIKTAINLLEDMGLYDGEAIMKAIPSSLSGGMRQRVGIAMAIYFKPSILLADEPTSALDVTIQAQIIRQLIDLNKQYQMSIILVTHNLGVAAYMSDRIVVMTKGEIVEIGSREDIINDPQHEYTKKLIKAIPDMQGVRYV